MIKRRPFLFRARGRELTLGEITRVMGIVNVTPDSFSGDGQLKQGNYIRMSVARAVKMTDEGADIVDIGGESTRPGALAVSAQEEVRRVVPVIEALVAARKNVLVSVDTSKASVAREALKAGAHIVNVVQANTVSRGLLDAVRCNEAGIVLMHMRGTPRTMRSKVHYRRFISEVLAELEQSLKKTLQAGIKRSNIVIDPGIGFAKTVQQNFLLIKELGRFKVLGFPVLIGPSRKSFIGSLLGVGPSERLTGTVAAVAVCAFQGAHIVRVHDVLQMKQAVRTVDAVLSGGK